ncbi:MAG: hypothetical protein KAR11_05865 [Phycisphaerae bacterium]|nr:hypothetical protein [Phycisphaerae bacterium]
MSTPRQNPQMFALPKAPPQSMTVRNSEYRLTRVFKHDFWAATCLYESTGADDEFPKIVVKFSRAHPIAGFPMEWIGRMLADHEQNIYAKLEGIAAVPRWVARISPVCYAIEYIDAVPLDHLESIPAGFFEQLREVFDTVHQRGVAYGDANKKSNILVTQDDKPILIDYQISVAKNDRWVFPLRQLRDKFANYLMDKDLYHLYKHKRRLAPGELTPEQDAISRKRSGLHLLHRKLTKPYRAMRRKFLKKQFEDGSLQSPTADMEDHHQPEKQTWRTSD